MRSVPTGGGPGAVCLTRRDGRTPCFDGDPPIPSQPTTNKVLAVGRARAGGIETAAAGPDAPLLALGGFEALAGSKLRRPAECTRMLDGRSLADVIGRDEAAGAGSPPARAAGARGGWGTVGARAPPAPAAALEALDDDNDEFCRVCWQGVSSCVPRGARGVGRRGERGGQYVRALCFC